MTRHKAKTELSGIKRKGGTNYSSVFSFIIMKRNSVVRGLHNPVCLWIVVLYNVVSPRTISPYLKISLLRFGTFRKKYASREVWANFRPSHLPFCNVTHNYSAFAPSRLLPRPRRTMSENGTRYTAKTEIYFFLSRKI